jgi:hypothetical protein
MRYEDLPAAMRAQVDAELGKTPKRRTSQRAARSGTTSRWKCASCAETFTSWAAAERHNPAHPRIEVVL